MEINQLIKKGKINALCQFGFEPRNFHDTFVYVKINYKKEHVKDYIMSFTNCDLKKMKQSFLLVNLKEDMMNKNIQNLSSSELLKVELAIQLILNREEIYLYQFDKYFMEKDLLFFKRLFKKLVTKYHKTIVFVESDFSFLFDFIDRLVILNDKNEVEVFQSDDFFSDKLASLIPVPPLIDFVRYVNRDKKVLNNYTSIYELMKAIFREV